MAGKIVNLLLYPWVDACLRAAYNEFLDERDFLTANKTDKEIVRVFMMYYLDEYMNKAFNKHKARIVFAPWSITTQPELYEYKFTI